MPYCFEFDPKSRVLRARFEGVVTDQCITEFYTRTSDYLARYGVRSGIIDFTEVTSFDVSPSTIHALARLEPASKDPSFVRVLIAPDPHIFGMGRMFQILGESTRPSFNVVHSREEAMALLGVRELQFERLE